jgi:ketosteroid isomerase-like protein
MLRLFLLPLLPALLTPTATAQPPAAVDSVYAAFSRAYRTYDAELLRSLYTADCRYLPARSSVGVQPCEEAMEGFEAMFEGARAGARRLEIAFRFVDRAAAGGLAYDVGYYALTAIEPGVPDGTPPTVAYGKFVTVLKRQPDGSWRIHVDGFSPAPAAAYEAAGQ